MCNKFIYSLVFLGSVLLSSISQILLKKSANNIYSKKIKEYLNVLVMLAYVLLFVSSILTLTAYKGIPLLMGPVLESTGYIWVVVLGGIFLHEKISRRKLLGILVIILGIIIFNLG